MVRSTETYDLVLIIQFVNVVMYENRQCEKEELAEIFLI